MGGAKLLRKRSVARPPECTKKTTSVILRLQRELRAFYLPADVSFLSAFCILTSSEKIRKKIRVFEICGILRAEEIRGVVNMQERKFISLAEARPDLAAEWNHKKNGILKPEDIAHKSGKKVWWIQYDKNPVNDK